MSLTIHSLLTSKYFPAAANLSLLQHHQLAHLMLNMTSHVLFPTLQLPISHTQTEQSTHLSKTSTARRTNNRLPTVLKTKVRGDLRNTQLDLSGWQLISHQPTETTLTSSTMTVSTTQLATSMTSRTTNPTHVSTITIPPPSYLNAFDVYIQLVSDKKMIMINHDYRQKTSVTDILSFPFQPVFSSAASTQLPLTSTTPDKVPEHTFDIPPNLRRYSVLDPPQEIHGVRDIGQIIIAPHEVVRQATALNVSYAERYIVLIVHGLCHLLGYDHEQSTDAEMMEAAERKILAQVGIIHPNDKS